ncbi:MAG TPA: hypothetical protein PLL30_17385 [Candidatus Krumholzibacteria bacterium]|nr:hypothetical protein [Candidatus Krumholzibacteria bacterium]HPD73550.1 hypothetical protein [Candidatus Krumholzibacteria bacterium]
MMTQKKAAGILDSAAARAEVTGRGSPATSRQCWFLAGLITKIGHDHDLDEFVIYRKPLSKKTASEMIESYLNDTAN